MADKRIQDLTPASSVGLTDLFVLEQSGAAKSLSGQILVNDLATALSGHGGINNISYTAPVSPSLNGTMTITMADTTQYTLSVTNGRGISSITWVDSGTPGDGETHTGTISYNDGTSSTVTFKDGVKGDQGQQTYVWFKWSQDYPTQDTDMQNSVAPYIGIYSGTASSAPSSYTSYTWYQYKGDVGATGASIQSIAKTSTSGLVDTYTVTMTDGNTSNFSVTNGKSIVSVEMTSGTHAAGTTDTYTITYNDGSADTFTVYNGANGLGSVSSVSGIQADGNGDVPQVISGNGAPTTATVGQENQLYYDLNNSVLYYCAGESGGTYVWQGAGVTVDSAFSGSSTNPVQNKVITNKVGTAALNTTAQDLSGAVNEILTDIPSPSTTTPQKDGTGAAGNGTTWARSNHVHPLNVPTSGVPADLGTAALGSATTYAKADHVHSLKILSTTPPADSSTVTDCLDYAKDLPYQIFSWAKWAAATYTPGGVSGNWQYTLYTAHADKNYVVFEANNAGTGELYRAKNDGTWVKVAPDAATATPANLGTAAAGSSSDYARADHVHNMPSASDVGAMSKWDLLWTNASQSSNFPAQTVGLNLSNYDAVCVVYRNQKGSDAGWNASHVVFRGVPTEGMVFNGNGGNLFRVTEMSDSGVTFQKGRTSNSYGSSTEDNQYAIPIRIYGIKGVQTS